MSRDVLAWVDAPRSDRGVTFVSGQRSDHRGWADIADEVRAVACGLRERGLERNDDVVVLLPPGHDFVAALFGILYAGGTATPVATAGVWRDKSRHRAHLEGVLAAARPRLVVTSDRAAELVTEVAHPGVGVTTVAGLASSGKLGGRAEPATHALIQFTSGSSGRPRGVRIPCSALAANVTAIIDWLGLDDGTPTAHWVPFHHDMGLVGGLVVPAATQGELTTLRPGDFLRDPFAYVRLFDDGGARAGTMPNFGLRHVVARFDPGRLDGVDLSGWDSLVLGAERLDPVVMEEFVRLLAPFGLPRTALRPAYGLAEATLAVTGLRSGEVPTYLEPPAASGVPDGAGRALVGCGPPLSATSVEIVDATGATCDDGVVGEIVVDGRGLADGYVQHGEPGGRSVEGSHTIFVDGRLFTGDAGLVSGGQLFPVGRLGDSVSLNGRMVFAEDLELSLHDSGMAPESMVVLLGLVEAQCRAVVVVEEAEGGLPAEDVAAIGSVVERHEPGLGVHIVQGSYGTIDRTTSGKPRRRQMWARYLAGTLVTP